MKATEKHIAEESKASNAKWDVNVKAVEADDLYETLDTSNLIVKTNVKAGPTVFLD